MQSKPIENYHVENAILAKDFNLGVIGSFFHAFTLVIFQTYKNVVLRSVHSFGWLL
jgi:hypothetical protein